MDTLTGGRQLSPRRHGRRDRNRDKQGIEDADLASQAAPSTAADRPSTKLVGTEKDARNRALRTVLQNLAVDALVAVATVLLAYLGRPDFTWATIDWTYLAASIGKTVLVTALAYVLRLKRPDAPSVTA